VTRWALLAGERLVMRSPIGLRLVDEFTGRPPIGEVRAHLELQDAQGNYQPTDIAGVLTPSAVVTYPGLGRRRSPLSAQPRRYRVSFEADLYYPLYSATPNGTPDGIVFVDQPYDDVVIPAAAPPLLDLALLPGPNYPFEGRYPVIRGVVRDAAGVRVKGARVWHGQKERVISGDKGAFSIGLRWVQAAQAQIFANDDQGHVGNVVVDVTDPNSRDVCQTITIQ
jgi:hypothetical protein